MLQDFRFETGIEGPKLLILGAVHGNEVAGPLACEKLIENIKNGEIVFKKGTITLVPVANPEAHKKNIRQIDENLNRVINHWESPKTYEQKLGVEIAKRIDDCDYMLDIHSTHNAGDLPFSFLDCPTLDNLKIVEALDVEYVLSGWPDVYGAQNAIVDYSTERYANMSGKNGITLESGYHKDAKAIDLAYASIVNLLKNLKMIDGEFEVKDKKIIKMTGIVIKEKSGKLAQDFKHLDFIKKDTTIAICDDGQKLFAEKDCYIIIPNPKAEIGAEWYYLGE